MAINLTTGFEILSSDPIDDRLVVTSRTADITVGIAYEGLVVYDTTDDKLYMLKDATAPGTAGSWEEVGSGSGGGPTGVPDAPTIAGDYELRVPTGGGDNIWTTASGGGGPDGIPDAPDNDTTAKKYTLALPASTGNATWSEETDLLTADNEWIGDNVFKNKAVDILAEETGATNGVSYVTFTKETTGGSSEDFTSIAGYTRGTGGGREGEMAILAHSGNGGAETIMAFKPGVATLGTSTSRVPLNLSYGTTAESTTALNQTDVDNGGIMFDTTANRLRTKIDAGAGASELKYIPYDTDPTLYGTTLLEGLNDTTAPILRASFAGTPGANVTYGQIQIGSQVSGGSFEDFASLVGTSSSATDGQLLIYTKDGAGDSTELSGTFTKFGFLTKQITASDGVSVSGLIETTGTNNISSGGQLIAAGNLTIDGISTLQGDVQANNDLRVGGNLSTEELTVREDLPKSVVIADPIGLVTNQKIFEGGFSSVYRGTNGSVSSTPVELLATEYDYNEGADDFHVGVTTKQFAYTEPASGSDTPTLKYTRSQSQQTFGANLDSVTIHNDANKSELISFFDVQYYGSRDQTTFDPGQIDKQGQFSFSSSNRTVDNAQAKFLFGAESSGTLKELEMENGTLTISSNIAADTYTLPNSRGTDGQTLLMNGANLEFGVPSIPAVIDWNSTEVKDRYFEDGTNISGVFGNGKSLLALFLPATDGDRKSGSGTENSLNFSGGIKAGVTTDDVVNFAAEVNTLQNGVYGPSPAFVIAGNRNSANQRGPVLEIHRNSGAAENARGSAISWTGESSAATSERAVLAATISYLRELDYAGFPGLGLDKARTDLTDIMKVPEKSDMQPSWHREVINTPGLTNTWHIRQRWHSTSASEEVFSIDHNGININSIQVCNASGLAVGDVCSDNQEKNFGGTRAGISLYRVVTT